MKKCSLSACVRLERLGVGSSAEVWQADLRGEPVAVKVFKPHDQAHALARQEIRAARLDHPNIARVLGGGRDAGDFGGSIGEGRPYVVQELAHGVAVGDVFAWARLKAILRGLLLALEHAHDRGLLHRDIKPANVLVDDGSNMRVKLVDWGLCWDMRPLARNAFRSYTAGTPRYMPLEQVLGQRALFGPWSDLFSLGCLAHRMATGFAPLRHETTSHAVFGRLERTALQQGRLPNNVRPEEWGQSFADWVGWLIAIPLRDRPQTAREALDALEAIDNPLEVNE